MRHSPRVGAAAGHAAEGALAATEFVIASARSLAAEIRPHRFGEPAVRRRRTPRAGSPTAASRRRCGSTGRPGRRPGAGEQAVEVFEGRVAAEARGRRRRWLARRVVEGDAQIELVPPALAASIAADLAARSAGSRSRRPIMFSRAPLSISRGARWPGRRAAAHQRVDLAAAVASWRREGEQGQRGDAEIRRGLRCGGRPRRRRGGRRSG